MRTENELQGVTLLGNQHVQYSDNYNPGVLETFPNKHPENEYLVTFNCPEFTTLCPKTGQPDFGHIYISYIPRERMVESKSLKLYLFSFRNHGDFHEDCVNIIMKDLVALMDPKYLEVCLPALRGTRCMLFRPVLPARILLVLLLQGLRLSIQDRPVRQKSPG